MNLDIYLNKTSNKHAENRLLKFAIWIMLFLSIISMVMANRAMKYQKTVLVPVGFDKRLEISDNTVNKDYVVHFTRYALNLLLNYHPKIVTGQYEELMTLCSPEFYPEFKKENDKLLENITRMQITSAFYPQSIEVDSEKKTITVLGVRKQFTHSAIVENTPKKYVIRYVVINGRFYLNGIEEKSSYA